MPGGIEPKHLLFPLRWSPVIFFSHHTFMSSHKDSSHVCASFFKQPSTESPPERPWYPSQAPYFAFLKHTLCQPLPFASLSCPFPSWNFNKILSYQNTRCWSGVVITFLGSCKSFRGSRSPVTAFFHPLLLPEMSHPKVNDFMDPHPGWSVSEKQAGKC